MHRDEVADHGIIELERALELGEDLALDAEARDDVVAGVLRPDLVGELASTPVVELDLILGAEEGVMLAQLLSDGGVFERGVEDVDRLILAGHDRQSSLWSRSAPRWLPEAGGGEWGARRPAAPDRPDVKSLVS